MSASAALEGVRVLDATGVEGALAARLLGDLGADVVRLEPPEGGALRRRSDELACFYTSDERAVALDPALARDRTALRQLVDHADVVFDERPSGLLDRFGIAVGARDGAASPLVRVAISAFGGIGPRAHWLGSDLVCAAASGMTFVNGHPGAPPITPFGLQAYHSAGVYAAIAALLALRRRRQTGRGAAIDVSVQAAAAAAVEHVTSFYRQHGSVEPRRGTLHWSRTFRIARCRTGDVLLCLLGDWTTLVEWVVSEGASPSLRDPRWEDVEERKRDCERIFDELDRWAATRDADAIAETAQLLRLPFARVRSPDELAGDPQLAARGFAVACPGGDGDRALPRVFPGAPFRLSATPWRLRRRPPRLGEHTAEVLADPRWTGAQAPSEASALARAGNARATGRPLAGVTVLDFTWVVAGPVATRILADHGARVVKVERKNAADFGWRRGGLSGNLNRGKQSIVLDLAVPRGRALARALAARSDVVIDNFSARVMPNLGLDYESLRRVGPGIVAVSMSGFGHDGPWRDHVSYGPTLQALAGFPLLMRLADGAPAGWGYSWSDMAGGMMAALATLAALEHRDRTGAGQWIDLAQYETLVALLGPGIFDALAGRAVAAPGNASQEGPAVPHGIYRCAPDVRDDGTPDDDRWIAIAVLDDDQWRALARVIASDGETWASAPELERFDDRAARGDAIERALERWTRQRAARELAERLQDAGVPAAAVANGEDVCRHDPQLAARGFFRSVRAPEGDLVTVDGLPLAGDVAGDVLAPGPLLGEHCDGVLREILGLSHAEIAALREEGVIA
ncbi:MAG TPA: CoA transferase [Candidatus Binatia bacterium]|nr:CoA transferase [Candidatus Binatia bacterium]